MEKTNFAQMKELYKRDTLYRLNRLNEDLLTHDLNDPEIRTNLNLLHHELTYFLSIAGTEELIEKINKS